MEGELFASTTLNTPKLTPKENKNIKTIERKIFGFNIKNIFTSHYMIFGSDLNYSRVVLINILNRNLLYYLNIV